MTGDRGRHAPPALGRVREGGARTGRRGSLSWRLTLRSLAANRVRTLVSLGGVILSTALVCAVLTTVTSLDHAMYQQAYETEGSWYVWSGATSDAAVRGLVRDERVSAVASSHELGSVLLDQGATERLGVNLLAVVELPRGLKGTEEQTEALVKGPVLAEGRLPESADEIVLPIRLKGMTLAAGEAPGDLELRVETEADAQAGEIISAETVSTAQADKRSGAASDGPLALGSRVTLELGTRTIEGSGPTSATDPRFLGTGSWSWAEQASGRTERHSYTVVGFRLPQGDYLGNNLIASPTSIVAVTGVDGASALAGLPTSQSVWASCDGYGSYDSFEEGMAVMGEDDAVPSVQLVRGDYLVHWSLVRYAGIVEKRSLFMGLWAIAWVLVAVIVATSVSLIYTSFALSVGERTRQFGLLASQGASSCQLRRMVLSEALLIAAVGIPVGLGAGLAGVAAVLRVIGPSLIELLGVTGMKALELSASPRLLALVAALALVVLLASAWVPARRAGRIPAVEAIRQVRDVRIGRSARREIERAGRRGTLPTSPASLPSPLARLAGVPGFVAHRNLSRATSRGRVVALSLAVSFALFVTAGVVTQYLGPFEDYAVGEGANLQSDLIARVNAGQTMDTSELEKMLGRAVRAAEGVEGARVMGAGLAGSLPVVIPASLLTDELRGVMEESDEASRELGIGEGGGLYAPHFADSGAYVGEASVSFVDEGTWERLAQEAGVDPAADDTALALGTFRMPQYDRTQPLRIADAFAAPGDITVIGTGESYLGIPDADELQRLGAGEVPEGSWTLHLGATTSDLTDAMVLYDAVASYPYLIAPARLLDAHPFVRAWSGLLSVQADDAATVAQDVADAIGSLEGDYSSSVYDVAGELRQARAALWMIRLFTLLFSGITMLIAVANVFNTLSNSIALRTREFAMLRSLGMGPSAFSRMIACECASYAVRGLVLGLVLAALVDLGVWHAIGLSFEGIAPMVPWGSLAAGALGVVAVTALSVGFALRRGATTSIVEALRVELA